MNYKKMQDIYRDDNRFYFVTNANISYQELEQEIGMQNDYMQVPNLLDKNNLKKYIFSSKECKSIQKDLKDMGVKDAKLQILYKNQATGFNRRMLNLHRMQKQVKKISEKPASIYYGELPWERLKYSNFCEVIQARKESQQSIHYLSSRGESIQTYSELYHNCMRIAAEMKKMGIKKGTKLIIQFDEKKDFVELFWSAVIIGAVIVSVAVLEDYENKNINADKLNYICNSFNNPVIVSTTERAHDVRQFMRLYQSEYPVITMEELRKGEKELENIQNKFLEEEPCMFFFTSGSTGMPKGVGLTQKNVFARTLGEIEMYGLNENLRDLNWMTLTHAAGAVWTMFRDIYLDAFQMQVATEYILKDPLRWIQLMHDYKITTSWAPNFAYALLGKCIEENKDYQWDLSSVTNLYSTAETNVSKSLRMFLKKVEKYGFPKNGLIPCFGMTETSSVMAYYNGFSYEKSSDKDLYVPMGTPQHGIELRIADSENHILCEGEVGYLQIKGDTVLKEYYQNPEATEKAFTEDGFLITGDMAYIEGKDVVITGREKNIIIVNGFNYCIEDMEEIADDLDGIENGYTAIFSVQEQEQESVILVFSPEDETLLNLECSNQLRFLLRKIRKNMLKKCFIPMNHVIPVSRKKFPREGIGKKQRATLKKQYEMGMFDEILQITEETQKQYVLRKTMTEIKNSLQDTKVNNCIVDTSFLDKPFFTTTIESKQIAEVYDYIFQNVRKYLQTEQKVVFPVLYQKEQFSWYRGILPALFRTLAMENTNFHFKLLFLEENENDLIERECNSLDGYDVVYYSNGKRYIETYETYNAVCKRENAAAFMDNKLVVLVGGFGGIGRLLSKYLLENYRNIRLLILGRKKKEDVKELLALYPKEQVLYGTADVTRYEQLDEVIEQAKQEVGREIGCIFNLTARGITKQDEMTITHAIEKKREDLYTESAVVKLLGLKNIECVRMKNNCKMYVLGSVTADFGMVNMSAYAVSNLLAEEYCSHLQQEKFVFICYSGWYNIVMNLKKNSEDMKEFLNHFDTSKSGFLEGFTAETGIRMLDNILTSGVGSCFAGINHEFKGLQYCITDPFEENLQLVVTSEEQMELVKKYIKSKYSLCQKKITVRIDPLRQVRQRDNTEGIEQEIKHIWEEYLAKDIKSFDDNLFDIGGNSLTVFQITEAVNQIFALQLNPIDIMTHSTIRSFSLLIRELSMDENQKKTKEKKVIARKRKLKAR